MKTFEELIETKRDGGSHSAEDIDRLVLGYTEGEMPDYQMAAWLMAAYLKGLGPDETVWLTDAMVRSGRVIDLSGISGVKLDKHSTGGVADTTTLIVAPLVASCGVAVAKMSGRGLGHTGGTLDKLEAIPGMQVELPAARFVQQVKDIGIAVIAQSPDIDPADKKLYALRDSTATVPSVPLIVGSIMSKKIAGGADAILLDVKAGTGAFMKTHDQARHLASELVRVGDVLGKRVSCVTSDMNQPLGMAVGNALEVAEAIRALQGEGSKMLSDFCLGISAKMLVLGEVVSDEDDGLHIAERAISTGAALERFERWVMAQGGDPKVAENPSLLPRATYSREVLTSEKGYVTAMDAEGIGRAAMLLGAGRATKDDTVDPGAGLVLHVRIGDELALGDIVATAYSSSESLLAAGEERLRSSVSIGKARVEPPPLFYEV